MNGVIRPDVSAGSNHVGASETWMPQVSWPCGPAAAAVRGVPAIAAPALKAKRLRRVMEIPLRPGAIIPVSSGRSLIPCSFGSLFVEPYSELKSSLGKCLHPPERPLGQGEPGTPALWRCRFKHATKLPTLRSQD